MGGVSLRSHTMLKFDQRKNVSRWRDLTVGTKDLGHVVNLGIINFDGGVYIGDLFARMDFSISRQEAAFENDPASD